jgi:hypothetical protein
MKRICLLLLFVSGALSLSAQQATTSYHETRIYVPPIDGIGMIDDMAYFYKQITGEITRQYRTLGKTRMMSDYVITGRLMPLTPEEIDISALPPGTENDEWILYIELFNNAINDVMSTQFLTYSYPDETTEESLSIIMYNMLAGVPDLLEGTGVFDPWRNKWLYTSLSLLWTPRVYQGIYSSINMASVGGEAMVDFHFLPFLSVKLGAEVVQDWVVVYTQGNTFMDMIMDIPLAVAFVLRPLDVFLMEPYIGVTYNLSLTNVTRPFPLSWMAGFDLGVKLGPGMLSFDPRFSMDFGKSQITNRPIEYWRYTIHIGVGYKFGFFDRN